MTVRVASILFGAAHGLLRTNVVLRMSSSQSGNGLDLVELRYRLSEKDKISAEELSECLIEFGAQSVDASDEDAGKAEERPIYREPSEAFDVFTDCASEFWSNCIVRAIVSKNIESSLVKQINEILNLQTLPERRMLDTSIDWLKEQEKLRPAIIVGDLRIILPWHKSESVTKLGDLRLEGGSAFGTGEHPTTRMCCQWIQAFHSPAFARIMDYGCGSGILALTALKTGRYAQAIGVDVDPDAIRACKRNAKANDFVHQAQFFLPAISSPFYTPRQSHFDYDDDDQFVSLPNDMPPFDLVIANILLNPLRDLSHTLASLVHSGHGVLAVSGIRKSQFQDFFDIYDPFFADINIQAEEDGW
eukprot:CAMPEP_0197292938 /NCGR_PEP_ID=MMETSP0890-20130614/25951_1 /TAXON_ID=44058 ORGANISM="Aureoumbra lagunensis, Strain CCMP1510" /NCGR_SAMPLE_ID=MMETSP0890 /ASSEMBLY_ACC=CAM_ASM_000533 /LENGTH=359 /DNA_ID=CAMNT_0042767267 /DNA_START=123 /DNA_END=1199 /DNA_ORIENTATION=-